MTEDPKERSPWIIRDGAEAGSQALKVFGLSPAEFPDVSGCLVILENDNTPFLHEQITNRPVWQVSIRNYRLHLRSVPAQVDRYNRDFEILLDPRDGKPLKIVSRWPEGIPESAPEPGAAFAEDQMVNTGREWYDSFPERPPDVSFLGALDAIYVSGFSNPLGAKQIVAQYVMQAWADRGLRRIWAINLRGIPPFRASASDVPVCARDHLRHFVDAGSGKWLGAITSPQPEDAPELDGQRDAATSRPNNEPPAAPASPLRR